MTRPFVGGRMYAVHARIPDFYREVPHPPAWMNVAFNPERRCFMPAVDGSGEFAFHTQLNSQQDENRVTEADAIAMVQQTIGAPLRVEVIARAPWTAGHSLVAESFARGRIFIGGDAAHLFTPTGGLGYNTAIEDAVNLGWKLAAVLKGQAGPDLLESYEAERRPLALRNTAYAKGFADSLGNYVPPPEIEDDTPAGEAARRRAGEYYAAHGRAEFNIPGITFGGRYDGSPAIVPDGTAPPPDTAERVRAERLPRRTPAAPVAARRALALRSLRLRVDAHGFHLERGPGSAGPEDPRAEKRGDARALRRGPRAHPPRPDRRLARQLGPGRARGFQAADE